jgi:hypothetical protein
MLVLEEGAGLGAVDLQAIHLEIGWDAGYSF